MSQHLITQFINRTYVFKSFDNAKIANKKLEKYQASNRHNNTSPEDVAESTHKLKDIKGESSEVQLKIQQEWANIDVVV